ncbi:hypothetical protein BH10PSE1_BH10PSE1_25090 [soil metagenome]
MARTVKKDPPCLSEDQFALLRARVEAVADRLCDAQRLELAHTYHEALRQRRAIRARHPQLSRPGQVEANPPD